MAEASASASGAGQAQQQQQRNRGTTAPVHHVPTARIIAIEHPGIVRNFDNGFRSLGGEAQLKHVLEHYVGDSKRNNKQNEHPEPVAGVSLRPNDPLAKKIPSIGIETQNVLVKVTLPKRTRRKRKRGSDDPFMELPETPNASITAPDLLRRLRDNEAKYTVEAVGMLRETHKFRVLPDFQLRNADVPLMRHMRDHAMQPDYEKLKTFRVDLSTKPIRHTALPGPPAFTTIDLPHKFEYRQPDAVIFVQDDAGQIITKNVSSAYRRIVTAYPPDVDKVPAHPPAQPSTFGANDTEVRNAIKLVQKLLSERPLITKRVALNNLPPISETVFKEATQYAGYSFKAGPFRDSLIRYGVDPRADPQYRFYQTLMFQVDKQAFKSSDKTSLRVSRKPSADHSTLWARPLRHTRDDPTTHIFDGQSITANGKTWQICDVTDPLVHRIFHTSDIRPDCDVHHHGWYYNGTMGKARGIMKDKMVHLFANEEPPEDVYEILAAAIPEELTSEKLGSAVLDSRVHGSHAVRLVTQVKSFAKAAQVKGAKEARLARRENGEALGEGEGSEGEESVGEGEGDFEGEEGEEEEQNEGEEQTARGEMMEGVESAKG